MDPGEEKEEVKLTAAEVKKYEARFTQLVVRFSDLQLKECIGKGELIYVSIDLLFTLESIYACTVKTHYVCLQVHLVRCLKAR